MKTALALFVLCCATTAAAVKQPTFYARQDYPGNGQVAVADLNGDKIPDVIALFGSIRTLLGNGDGTFRVGPITSPGRLQTNAFVAADLNGDGYADVIMSVYGGTGIAVSLGNGDGIGRAS